MAKAGLRQIANGVEASRVPARVRRPGLRGDVVWRHPRCTTHRPGERLLGPLCGAGALTGCLRKGTEEDRVCRGNWGLSRPNWMPRSGQTSPQIAGRAKERSRSRAGLKEGQDRPSGAEAHGRLSGCRAGRSSETELKADTGPDDSSISDGTETLNEPRTQLVDYISNKVRDRSRDGRNDVPET
ncbi:hypothetical protein NDU88_008283 [Pleurodeles waltl]|uniref:Uncharacterized protein n=1 Tax=Pleurodeles waltl TaxID=8319 RepID=A0AAV7SUU2_PLEWA|nr:hypothetical protein NDU88_008283 [Pleurodeles waltl]